MLDIDAMANVRKMKTSNVRKFGEFCDNVKCNSLYKKVWYFLFDSYVENTIKEREKEKEKKPSIEVHSINKETPLPVEMERFCPSIRNKTKLEALLH